MGKFKTFDEMIGEKKISNDKVNKDDVKIVLSTQPKQRIKGFYDYIDWHSKMKVVKPRETFLEGKKIEHLIDDLSDDELEEELPVANSYSEAEVGSILTYDMIDEDMIEVMQRVGEKGVIYTELSKYYWQVRGDNLVRIA